MLNANILPTWFTYICARVSHGVTVTLIFINMKTIQAIFAVVIVLVSNQGYAGDSVAIKGEEEIKIDGFFKAGSVSVTIKADNAGINCYALSDDGKNYNIESSDSDGAHTCRLSWKSTGKRYIVGVYNLMKEDNSFKVYISY